MRNEQGGSALRESVQRAWSRTLIDGFWGHRLDHNCRRSWYVPTAVRVKEPRASTRERNPISEALFVVPKVLVSNGANSRERHARRKTLADEPPVSYTHLRAHKTRHDIVCRLLLEKKNKYLYSIYKSNSAACISIRKESSTTSK